MRNNLLLTGLPRCGTTLMTALIDGMDDSVALNEPAWQFEWLQGKGRAEPEAFTKWLIADYARVRHDLLNAIPVPERRREDGSAVTNYHRLRQQDPEAAKSYTTTDFTRPGLTPDFTLAMKHVGPYMGALPSIVASEAFHVIAIVRNPVGVLASWNEVPIPVGQGKMPGAAVQWKEMAMLTRTPMPLLEKQVRLYDLLVERLYAAREHIDILTYEELVDDPYLLSEIVGKPVKLTPHLIEKREVEFYKTDTDAIAKAVRQYGKYCKHFYPDL